MSVCVCVRVYIYIERERVCMYIYIHTRVRTLKKKKIESVKQPYSDSASSDTIVLCNSGSVCNAMH